jgi:eukaryotic-like serine/threonine-protein kinase
MTAPPAVTLVVCPQCGAKNVGAALKCRQCGEAFESDESSERMTLPSNASIEPPSQPESDRQPAHPNLEEISDERESYSPQEPDPLIGFVVAGRYRILERIGRGGMGVVYKVEHTEIGKLLALKLLAGELSREREIVRRFKREALLASRLSHPNSVQVFDFGVSDGLTFIVMELVTGCDLARVIKNGGPMAPDRVAKIMIQVCSSLAEAHAIGIVHRDLKPENILVARSKEGSELAKVLDFGLAKLREAPELNEVTSSGTVVGTPYYMAPEQICDQPVDHRADIYSLGAVMYKCLTGETLFPGSTPMAVFTRHLTEVPIAPHIRTPHLAIPEAFSRIVMRALEKDPSARFQRVEELQAALIDAAGGLGQSSLEMLLNSAQLHAMQAAAFQGAGTDSSEASRTGMARTLVRPAIATRDEVEAFKRKLVRQRWINRGLVAVAATALAIGGLRAWRRAVAPPEFNGFEIEPNSQAREAQDIPFGAHVKGQIGKRIDTERSDRDFFRMIVPPSSPVVALGCTALPNLPLCVWAYRAGEAEPIAKYCTGRPGVGLSIPALRMDPATYLLAVMQDLNPYGSPNNPFVLENVSDFYELSVGPAAAAPDLEVEPNDAPAIASRVPAGGQVRGRFGWVDDLDVVCVSDAASAGRLRWVVVDAEQRPRDRGSVLQVARIEGARDKASVRVHRAGVTAASKAGPEDVVGPWKSAAFEASAPAAPSCLGLRLTHDPWAGADAPLTPPVSNEQWVVRVELAP